MHWCTVAAQTFNCTACNNEMDFILFIFTVLVMSFCDSSYIQCIYIEVHGHIAHLLFSTFNCCRLFATATNREKILLSSTFNEFSC